MAYEPTVDVLAALRSAAAATNVPLSLLWGVAFAESSFDPTKVGPLTAAGVQAKGLMQLTPDVIAKYRVTDPFDAQQSALAGAKYLAALAKPLAWDVPAMLGAYVWGAANYARMKATGGKLPAEVSTYVRRALAARDVYRAKADRPLGSLMSALNTAIMNLAALNPTWAPATMARDAWTQRSATWPGYAARSGDTDAAALLNPLLRAQWRNYQLAYERAPITDESTPRPELVEPDLWAGVSQTVDRAKKAATEGAYGLGAGLFVVALFLFAVSSRR